MGLELFCPAALTIFTPVGITSLKIGQLLYGLGASFANFGSRAAEKQRTLVDTVALQNAQHESKPLEVCKAQHGVQVEMAARLLIVREDSWEKRGGIGTLPSWIQFTNCVFNNHALCPGACPFPKHPVRSNATLNTRKKEPFCRFVIARKEKRELIKTMQIIVKSLKEILASRVTT